MLIIMLQHRYYTVYCVFNGGLVKNAVGINTGINKESSASPRPRTYIAERGEVGNDDRF
jgi:hypothetical protein